MNHLFPLFLNCHFFQACRAMYFAPLISGLHCGFLNAFLPGTAPGGTGLSASPPCLHAAGHKLLPQELPGQDPNANVC